MPLVSRFSTDILPARDRVGIFREEIGHRMIRLDIEPDQAHDFSVQMSAAQLGAVGVIHVATSPLIYGRSRQMVTDGQDHFVLLINTGTRFRSTRADVVVETGEGVILDSSNIDSIAMPQGSGGLSIAIPRKTLLDLVPGAEDLPQAGIRFSAPDLALLRGYLALVLDGAATTPDAMPLVGNHVAELVAMLLDAHAKAVGLLPNAQGLRAARTAAVRAVIDRRFSEPGLTLGKVAREAGLSARYVQLLFEDDGTSYTDHVTERRLGAARARLEHPLAGHWRIADIAFTCGFGDLSHFNRQFKARFGASPSDIREAARRDRLANA